jgi:hypothetical protein
MDQKNRSDPIMAACFPLVGEEINWDMPIYIGLEDIEVCDCECNRKKIDEIESAPLAL